MVTTHLVHFFFDGATAPEVIDEWDGFHSVPPYAFFSGFTPSDVVVVPVAEVERAVGGGLPRRRRRFYIFDEPPEEEKPKKKKKQYYVIEQNPHIDAGLIGSEPIRAIFPEIEPIKIQIPKFEFRPRKNDDDEVLLLI